MRPLFPSALATLTLFLSAPSPADAGIQTSDVPTFSYRDRVLTVGFVAHAEATGEIRWRGVLASGGLGPERRRKLDVQVGLNGLELPVGAESAHFVKLAAGDLQLELLANRGSWFALPRELRIDQTQKELGLDSKLTTPRDVVLARGFTAVATTGDGVSPLEVGRTFSRGSEGGLPLSQFAGLVIVAGGSVGPVRVTLTEKRGKLDVYWDTEVDLSTDFKRIVIPLASLVAREPKTRGRPRTAYSVSLRAATPSLRGGGIELDLLGLVRKVPALPTVRRDGENVRFSALPKGPFSSIEVNIEEESGSRRVETLADKGFELKSLGQLRYWYCYEELTGAKVCDPPDAPSTAHSVPPMPGGRLVIDDFGSRVAVNRFRTPVETFASDPGLNARPFAVRKKGRLLLRLDEAPNPSAYVGLKIPLPRIDSSIRTLEIGLAGVTGAERIDLGLHTSSGAEPKLLLSDYYDGRMARIPLAAFAAMHGSSARKRKLGRPTAITVALGPRSSCELERVSMTWEVAPIVVARFEGALGSRTSLGGKVAAKGTGAIKVKSSTVARGDGRVLRVELRRAPGRSSAIVALGFGPVDTRAHEALVFSLTDASSSADAQVVLTAGKRTARVSLGRYAKGDGSLERVAIPLRDFGSRLPREGVTQISLSFEAKDAASGFIELDDVQFE